MKLCKIAEIKLLELEIIDPEAETVSSICSMSMVKVAINIITTLLGARIQVFDEEVHILAAEKNC